MKIIPIYNFCLLPSDYDAITLYPFVCFSDPEELVYKSTMKHEMIHVKQIREIGWLSFYCSYFLYFLAGLIELKSWDDAYMAIPFEIEAREKEHSPLTQSEKDELGL